MKMEDSFTALWGLVAGFVGWSSFFRLEKRISSTGLIEGINTSALVGAPSTRPQLSCNARNSGSDTPSGVLFAATSSGAIRKLSEALAAELAEAAGTERASASDAAPPANTSLPISDWPVAKALRNIKLKTFFGDRHPLWLLPRCRLRDPFQGGYSANPSCSLRLEGSFEPMQPTHGNHGLNRHLNAASR